MMSELPSQLVIKFLNNVLSQQPWALEKLQPYAGKVIRLMAGDLALNLAITPYGQFTVAQTEQAPNVTVLLPKEQIGALVTVLSQGSGLDAVADVLHIQGEVGLARVIADLTKVLKWDYEKDLARVLGPMLAHYVVKTNAFVLEASKKGVKNMGSFVAEGLLKHDIVAPVPEFISFKYDLSKLDEKLRQLEQRVATLAISKAKA